MYKYSHNFKVGDLLIETYSKLLVKVVELAWDCIGNARIFYTLADDLSAYPFIYGASLEANFERVMNLPQANATIAE